MLSEWKKGQKNNNKKLAQTRAAKQIIYTYAFVDLFARQKPKIDERKRKKGELIGRKEKLLVAHFDLVSMDASVSVQMYIYAHTLARFRLI